MPRVKSIVTGREHDVPASHFSLNHPDYEVVSDAEEASPSNESNQDDALQAEMAKYSIEDTDTSWKVISLDGVPVAKANGQANAEAKVKELAEQALSGE